MNSRSIRPPRIRTSPSVPELDRARRDHAYHRAEYKAGREHGQGYQRHAPGPPGSSGAQARHGGQRRQYGAPPGRGQRIVRKTRPRGARRPAQMPGNRRCPPRSARPALPTRRQRQRRRDRAYQGHIRDEPPNANAREQADGAGRTGQRERRHHHRPGGQQHEKERRKYPKDTQPQPRERAGTLLTARSGELCRQHSRVAQASGGLLLEQPSALLKAKCCSYSSTTSPASSTPRRFSSRPSAEIYSFLVIVLTLQNCIHGARKGEIFLPVPLQRLPAQPGQGVILSRRPAALLLQIGG